MDTISAISLLSPQFQCLENMSQIVQIYEHQLTGSHFLPCSFCHSLSLPLPEQGQNHEVIIINGYYQRRTQCGETGSTVEAQQQQQLLLEHHCLATRSEVNATLTQLLHSHNICQLMHKRITLI